MQLSEFPGKSWKLGSNHSLLKRIRKMGTMSDKHAAADRSRRVATRTFKRWRTHSGGQAKS